MKRNVIERYLAAPGVLRAGDEGNEMYSVRNRLHSLAEAARKERVHRAFRQ